MHAIRRHRRFAGHSPQPPTALAHPGRTTAPPPLGSRWGWRRWPRWCPP